MAVGKTAIFFGGVVLFAIILLSHLSHGEAHLLTALSKAVERIMDREEPLPEAKKLIEKWKQYSVMDWKEAEDAIFHKDKVMDVVRNAEASIAKKLSNGIIDKYTESLSEDEAATKTRILANKARNLEARYIEDLREQYQSVLKDAAIRLEARKDALKTNIRQFQEANLSQPAHKLRPLLRRYTDMTFRLLQVDPKEGVKEQENFIVRTIMDSVRRVRAELREKTQTRASEAAVRFPGYPPPMRKNVRALAAESLSQWGAPFRRTRYPRDDFPPDRPVSQPVRKYDGYTRENPYAAERRSLFGGGRMFPPYRPRRMD